MTAQMDHASNPRGRRKARDGERAMDADRQRSARAQEPVTAEQARTRLAVLTRLPDRDDPDAPRRLAAVMAVSAQRAWSRLAAWMAIGGPEPDVHAMTVMRLETALTVALMALDQADRDRARQSVRLILDAWSADDGDDITGQLLAGRLAALGIDPDEVTALEAAATDREVS